VLRRSPALLPFLFALALHAESPAPGLTLGPLVPVAEAHVGGNSFGNELAGVTPDGDGFRVWYYRIDDAGALHSVHIDASGNTDFATDRRVFPTATVANYFTPRAAGGKTLLFWSSPANGLRVSAAAGDGTAVDPAGMPIPLPAGYCDAACNAERCLVVPEDASAAGAGTLLSTSGQIIEPRLALPFLALAGADDQGFLLTGVTGALHAVRIDNAGLRTFDTVIQPGPVDATASADFDGQQYTLVWQNQGGDLSTYAAHLTLSGVLEPPRKLLTADRAEVFGTFGNVLWNGREHLYLYGLEGLPSIIPELVPSSILYVQHLDRDLTPIGGPRTLPHTVAGTNFVYPGAVNAGSTYFAWMEGCSFFASDTVLHGVLIDASRNLTIGNGIAAARSRNTRRRSPPPATRPSRSGASSIRTGSTRCRPRANRSGSHASRGAAIGSTCSRARLRT
jgi:hypothetical protein